MKLMLAIALSHDAKLLILDEPTSGLDVLARDELMGHAARLHRGRRAFGAVQHPYHRRPRTCVRTSSPTSLVEGSTTPR